MHRRKRTLLLVTAAVLTAAVTFVGYRHLYPPTAFKPERLAAYYRALRVPAVAPVDVAGVRDAIGAAAQYIRRANHADGRFDYLVNTDPAVVVKPDYNMLRHAGALYALGMADDVAPDPANVEVMRRTVDFMRRCCYVKFRKPDMTGVRELRGTPSGDGPTDYKLGGVGLGLIALVTLERKSPGSVPSGEMDQLSNFGRFMQTDDGDFYSNYKPEQGGLTGLGQGLYYPGEMSLGWLMRQDIRPSRPEFDAALAAMTFLAKKRARGGEVPPDHWVLLATARLLQVADRQGIPVPRQQLINLGLQVCDRMLEDARIPQALPVMDGSLVPNGVVTPTATRLEGLLAARTFLPPDHPIVPHIDAAIHRGIAFLLRAQVKSGPYAGGMPHAIARLPDEQGHPKVRAFNEQATEIRIDYVQHSLSALVEYLRWRNGESPLGP